MPDRYPPINPKCPRFLHGGDYNPDQWPPEVWDEDMRLMKLAHCNAMSVGIFSWAQLEPEEGRYTFGWLDAIMDKLAAQGAYAVLATPSAAQPAWLSAKYPEVLRVGIDRIRRFHRGRVNYCLTSPVYRQKTAEIARKLAERYRDHPALLVWHIHNEYGGACFCNLCEEAFRQWLMRKYGSLDRLNEQWWTAFWGHTFTRWEQIRAPGGPIGEESINGMLLDWKRFVTDQTVACLKNEADVLHEVTPDVPVTTNMMGMYPELDYWKFVPALDVIAWDCYPFYHDRDEDWMVAANVSFTHDINRSFKGGKPFMLMETTPSSANWMPVMKLKRPGVHKLTCLQAVAHGADTVQYFQWRKGRGGAEKLHGAVVDHCGHENTRVFRDVAEVGEALQKLDDVIGTSVRPDVALIYDWENNWAVEGSGGPRNPRKGYLEVCQAHYRPFWKLGVPVDVINMDCPFSGYRLLVAPMLYMVRPGVAERIEEFVRGGGAFVATYWSGIVNENDLCFTGGWPGPLRTCLGIWAEELDVLYDDESRRVVPVPGNALGLKRRYEARIYCDLIHAEGAKVLAKYADDFYAGRPALTVNAFGKGLAYYMAFRSDGAFLDDFYGALARKLKLRRALEARLPEGVTAQLREGGGRTFVFLLNFKRKAQRVSLGRGRFEDVLTGRAVRSPFNLPGYGSAVLRRR
jgi:beta-galactosidase